MAYRDDHEAAVERADALAVELERERATNAVDSERVAQLQAELTATRDNLARLQNELSRIRPGIRPGTATAPAPRDPSRPVHGMPVIVAAIVIAMIAIGALVMHSSRDMERNEPARAAQLSPPFAADSILHDGLAMLGSRHMSQLDIEFIRPDGLLDPKYGSMKIETAPPPDPPDDPSRPTGAPRNDSVDMFMRTCSTPQWSRRGGWKMADGFCVGFGKPPVGVPVCTPSQVLALAHADGAPAGLALLTAKSTLTSKWQWTIMINDLDRNIFFDKTYEDCAH